MTADLRALQDRLRATKPHCNFGSDLAAKDAHAAADEMSALLDEIEAKDVRIAKLEAALFDANGAFLTIYAGLRGDRPTNRLNAAKGIAFEQINKIATSRQALSQSPSQGDQTRAGGHLQTNGD